MEVDDANACPFILILVFPVHFSYCTDNSFVTCVKYNNKILLVQIYGLIL